MNLFYAPELSTQMSLYNFNKEESRHIIKALRQKKGDILFLTNGKGDWFEAEIILDDPKKTTVKILKHEAKSKRPFRLHVAIAPTKRNERLEWFLEKATEIGIDEITPLLCRFSERKKINKERYERILIAAMKQSLQVYKPKLNDLITFKDFITQKHLENEKLVAYCKAEVDLNTQIKPARDLLIMIGPEGGFSQEEIVFAKDSGFVPVKLSENRLRTETAGLISVVTAQLMNNFH